MEPFGKALKAYNDGDPGAVLIVRRDDGMESPLPVAHFFRGEGEFTDIEKRAIGLCRGRVLDIGVGSGSISILLQARGMRATALDISSEAVSVARRRGVIDARCVDVFSFQEGQFDTLLMMGHGIGMVESIDGLNRFLVHARTLLASAGQIILDSLDVRATENPVHLSYHEMLRKAGRYIGEVRMQFEFRGEKGPYCGWLQVDPGTIGAIAESQGWKCEIVLQESTGDYLARLTT